MQFVIVVQNNTLLNIYCINALFTNLPGKTGYGYWMITLLIGCSMYARIFDPLQMIEQQHLKRKKKKQCVLNLLANYLI